MQNILLKLLYVFAKVNHPKVRKNFRYFIRDNYYSRCNQVKYFLKDYYLKKQYKTIEYHGEFQQELTFILPFAYWHYLNGTLCKTISCTNTKDLYFFSPNHEERYEKRDWTYDYNFEIPNMTHSITFSFQKWARVPLKEHYKNDLFIYDKPILIIANKYNVEWDNPPLNFLDIPTLDKLINLLKSKYQIIYNRPLSTQIVSDNSEIMDLNEYDWLRENHPNVLLMNDLYFQHKASVNSFNHLQLRVYANCDRFISVHGGTGTLASYFGGINILLSKSGIEHHFNEFNTIFPALSGAKIIHVVHENEVIEYAQGYL